MKKATTLKRVQFDIEQEELENLDRLKEILGVRTRREVLDAALAVLEWVIEAYMAGREIGTIDEATKSYRIYELGILRKVARVAKRYLGGPER